jgi:hypothetical protein
MQIVHAVEREQAMLQGERAVLRSIQRADLPLLWKLLEDLEVKVGRRRDRSYLYRSPGTRRGLTKMPPTRPQTRPGLPSRSMAGSLGSAACTASIISTVGVSLASLLAGPFGARALDRV